MTFLQAMGVVFCVILGVGIILGVVIGYEQARCRRIIVNSKMNKIDELCKRTSHLKIDMDQVLIRIAELERDIMRMKGKV